MLLTDVNRHNLIVDPDWNIVCHIGLEWTAILPVEFMQPLLWPTNQAVDQVDVNAYNKLREELMLIFEEEEKKAKMKNVAPLLHDGKALQLSSIMNKSWDRSTFWYVHAMQSPTGLHPIFYERLQPLFARPHHEDNQFCLYTFHTGYDGHMNSSTKRSVTEQSMTRSYVKHSKNQKSQGFLSNCTMISRE